MTREARDAALGPDGSGGMVRLWDVSTQTVPILIDGQPALARAGDTLLTAILLARADLGAFSPSRRTRAGFCLIGACQDCWVRVEGRGPVRACTTEVSPNMAVLTTPTDHRW